LATRIFLKENILKREKNTKRIKMILGEWEVGNKNKIFCF